MMVNFMILFGVATVLRYLVIHYSGVFLRVFLDEINISVSGL